MSMFGSGSKALVVGFTLALACGKTTAAREGDAGASGGFTASGGDSSDRSPSAGGNSGTGGTLLTSGADSDAGGTPSPSGNDSGAAGVVVPGGEAGAGGAPPIMQPPSTTCAQIRVPTATEEPIQLRVVGTDQAGIVTGAWSVEGLCAQDSLRASTCYSNVPVGGERLTTYFKIQVRTPDAAAWIDLDIPLRIEHDGMPTFTSQVVWEGGAMASWLTGYQEEVGSWCGENRPEPGSNWLSGSIDLGAIINDKVLPANVVRFGPPIAQDSTTVGATNVADDPRFLTMWMNALTASDDVDADGVPDDQDLCLDRAGVNYAHHDDRLDANANGVGDNCETWCFVPSDDVYADLYDFDGDGVDDLCDNAYTRFNPSQYVDL